MRHIKQNVTGTITLNGKPVRAAGLRKTCAYVPQSDVLLATATVRLYLVSFFSALVCFDIKTVIAKPV